jgi:hypothetical protein
MWAETGLIGSSILMDSYYPRTSCPFDRTILALGQDMVSLFAGSSIYLL